MSTAIDIVSTSFVRGVSTPILYFDLLLPQCAKLCIGRLKFLAECHVILLLAIGTSNLYDLPAGEAVVRRSSAR